MSSFQPFFFSVAVTEYQMLNNLDGSLFWLMVLDAETPQSDLHLFRVQSGLLLLQAMTKSRRASGHV